MSDVTSMKPEDVVQKFREKGLMGAGGAGFPTYDKLLLASQADKFVKIFDALKQVFGYESIIIGAKDKDQDKLDKLAEEYGFEMRYSPSTYGMGEERWLVKAVTGTEVPADKIPPQVGYTVNNVETLYNMYMALFEDEPVLDKYFNVYGEVARQTVFRAPIGTYVVDLLGKVGIDTSNSHNLTVIDGGPMMGDLICGESKRITDEGLETTERKLLDQGITKKTNGLLVVDRSLYSADQQAFKHEKGKEPPAWEDTLPVIMEKLGIERYLDWHPTPDDIVDLKDEVKRVRIAMKQGPIGKPSVPTVKQGDEVKRGDVIAKPAGEDPTDFGTLSVTHHASIDGAVTQVSEDHVLIERT